MEMVFGVGKKTGNSGDQECWASGHPKSLIPPKPLPVPTRVCRASRQGWRSTLGMSFWEGAPPAPPGPGPLCRDAHWPPNPGTWVRVVGSSPTSPPGAHGREERSAGEAGMRLGGLEDPHPASGPSQVAEQFVFLAPVHLGCPLAGALLVRPLLGHGQRNVKVQEGAGC